MKKRVIILAAVILLSPILVLAVIGYYYGVLSPIAITEEDIGPYTLVYLTRTGDYRESSDVLYKIQQNLTEKYSVTPALSFGIYYDNPALIEPRELRADLGAMWKTPLDGPLLARLGNDYKIRTMERTPCYIATFPFKNAASPMIGALKVYPLLSAYLADKQVPTTPTMEIYDRTEGKILYIVPKFQ